MGANQLTRIQGALGTAETGDNLVAVARDAHTAELAYASLIRKLYEEIGGDRTEEIINSK